jgi:hypothetical protein
MLHGDSVGIGTRLRAGLPKNRGSVAGLVKIFFCFPKCSDWLWGPPGLLSNKKNGLFRRSVKATTHFHLLPRLRIRGGILPLPHTCLCSGA